MPNVPDVLSVMGVPGVSGVPGCAGCAGCEHAQSAHEACQALPVTSDSRSHSTSKLSATTRRCGDATAHKPEARPTANSSNSAQPGGGIRATRRGDSSDTQSTALALWSRVSVQVRIPPPVS